MRTTGGSGNPALSVSRRIWSKAGGHQVDNTITAALALRELGVPAEAGIHLALKTNYATALRVEDLAKMAGMGLSTFHNHFRALTAMSPLQYQKQLRLQAARARMLMDGLDAASAAFEVGYESASQLNREYSRLFGQPPMRDIKTLRNGKVVSIHAA